MVELNMYFDSDLSKICCFISICIEYDFMCKEFLVYFTMEISCP